MKDFVMLTLACAATAHFVLTCVMSLYARHKIQYLCLAWVNGLFFVMLVGAACFSGQIAQGAPGMLHPVMLLSLVVTSYLQSIHPLSIPMPGYLQWGRMWRYALPAIILIAVYIPILIYFGTSLPVMDSVEDVAKGLFKTDMPLRLVSLGLSIYYIVNIFRLPHLIARHTDVPRYLVGYCTAMGITVLYYVSVSVYYSPLGLMVYIMMFTVVNLYLAFRTLETMALDLPKPVIGVVYSEPAADEVEKAEQEDFNRANMQRFQRITFWMQNHRSLWTDNSFGRDRLCEETGYNRHLVLQCVRSQGFNNVHDYINSYRIEALKQLVASGRIRTVADCAMVGFGTPKTARSCFARTEDMNLDDYLSIHAFKRSAEAAAAMETPSEETEKPAQG